MKMKTPDEIKKGLMICSGEPKNEFVDNCDLGCPYNIDGQFLCGIASMMEDALAYIEQLEDKLNEKEQTMSAQ